MSRPKSFTYELIEPVQHGSLLIENLTFQRPKGRHFRKLRALDSKGMTGDDALNLMGDLCAQPPSVMDEVDAVDLAKIGDKLSDFFDFDLPTSTS